MRWAGSHTLASEREEDRKQNVREERGSSYIMASCMSSLWHAGRLVAVRVDIRHVRLPTGDAHDLRMSGDAVLLVVDSCNMEPISAASPCDRIAVWHLSLSGTF